MAALYDIHGNLPALEAVLQDIRQEKVDLIVVGGDVLPGPMPSETIACLMGLDIPLPFISGNGDRVVLAQIAGRDISEVPEQFRDVIRWNAQQLHPEEEQLLARWPKTLRLQISGLGEVLFCHATPRSDTEIFTRLTTEESLLSVFAGVTSAVVVCGHTHMQFDRRVGKIRVVNAGSVGMPFGEPGADWLSLGPDIQLRHTSYDLAKAAERIRRTNYPDAENLAQNHVLHPPSQQKMLEAFSRAN